MDETCWLHFQQRNHGEVVLVEHNTIYQTLDTSRLVLLVRGPRFTTDKGLPERACLIHKIKRAILVDCRLHLDSGTITALGDSPHAGTSLYPIEQNNKGESATRFYSFALVPICSCIILIEEEFGGLEGLLRTLRQVADNPTGQPRHRPMILISRTTPTTTLSTDDLDNHLIGYILAKCNPGRQHTHTSAIQVWEACFSSINNLYGVKGYSDLCNRAVRKVEDVWKHEYVIKNIASLMRAAVSHFSRGTPCVSNVIAAMRTFPVPDQLSEHIHSVLRSAGKKHAEHARFVAASALAMDAHRAGIHILPPELVFNNVYSDVIARLQRLGHELDTLKKKFIDIIKAGRCEPDPVDVHRKMISRYTKTSMAGNATCLTCLSNWPSYDLPCGYRVCARCVRNFGRHVRGTQFQLGTCMPCGQNHQGPFDVGPAIAGVRILEISGDVRNAPGIAENLKSLSSRLPGPLHNYFDVVVGCGVGLFFTMMIFCKGATLDDCMHHIKSLGRFKENRGWLRFGSGLEFKVEELESKQVKVVRSQEELRRTWPGYRRHSIHRYQGDKLTGETTRVHAGALLASLFFLELVDSSYDGGLLMVKLEVKCRLPPGAQLLSVMNRVGQAGLLICGKKQELFHKDKWDYMGAFSKVLSLKVPHDTTHIDAKFEGSDMDGASLSNCPLSLHDLDVSAGQR